MAFRLPSRVLMRIVLLCAIVPAAVRAAEAQVLGNAGSVQGRVEDPSGAAIAGAVIDIRNAVSAYQRSTITNAHGEFYFDNVPFNSYELTVAAAGFHASKKVLSLRSSLPEHVDLVLQVQGGSEEVEVTAEQSLLENSPTAHTDMDREMVSRLPLETSPSQLSSMLTLAVPGLPADSNGQLDPFGEEGDTLLVVDGQPITERQSRTTATQIPLSAVQSFEVIEGVPPAEFSEKNSLVVSMNTRSGVGQVQPAGAFNIGYGSFGTSLASFSIAVGGRQLGNFIAADGLNTGRVLDSPEFDPVHDRGNSENVFDRADYQWDEVDAVHLNLGWSRSWFQAPNTYDQTLTGQDQRQRLQTFVAAPSYSHLLSASAVWNVNAWVRHQQVNYYPSADLFSDQPATLGQSRRLTSTGVRSDISYTKGMHNIKVGAQFQEYLLGEIFHIGITSPLFNSPCVGTDGIPVVAPAVTDPSGCAAAGYGANGNFQAGLLNIDLTRGGSESNFRGDTTIRQEAAYVQDSISFGHVSVMAGLRFDNYDGLSSQNSFQPRLGLSYLFNKTQTVLRASYGRLFETPYNDNLILSSATGRGGVPNQFFGAALPITPGTRDQFNVGIQQAIGPWMAINAEYTWRFSSPDFDSDALLETPLIFPTSWRKSKIDGAAIRIVFPEHHGLSAFSSLGHVRARFFAPETGGILFEASGSNAPFRIDQDQALQQSTHLQYQPWKRAPWFSFTWRYDSGLVVDSVDNFASALTLTADQQTAIGLFCGEQAASLTSPIRSCSASSFGAERLVIPAAGTQDPDRNPTRVSPRHLFDVGSGLDNIFLADRYRVNFRFGVLNLTNNVALYNFLSTFSGTHFVAPRSYLAQVGVTF